MGCAHAALFLSLITDRTLDEAVRVRLRQAGIQSGNRWNQSGRFPRRTLSRRRLPLLEQKKLANDIKLVLRLALGLAL